MIEPQEGELYAWYLRGASGKMSDGQGVSGRFIGYDVDGGVVIESYNMPGFQFKVPKERVFLIEPYTPGNYTWKAWGEIVVHMEGAGD